MLVFVLYLEALSRVPCLEYVETPLCWMYHDAQCELFLSECENLEVP